MPFIATIFVGKHHLARNRRPSCPSPSFFSQRNTVYDVSGVLWWDCKEDCRWSRGCRSRGWVVEGEGEWRGKAEALIGLYACNIYFSTRMRKYCLIVILAQTINLQYQQRRLRIQVGWRQPKFLSIIIIYATLYLRKVPGIRSSRIII